MAASRLFGVAIVVSTICYAQSDDHHDLNPTVDDEKLLKSHNVVANSDSLVWVINQIPQQFLPPKNRARFRNPIPLQSHPPKKREKFGEKKKTKKKKKKKSSVVVDQEPIPLELLRQIRTTEPVFLYQKEVKKSDVIKSQNMLFVNAREKFEKLMNFGEHAIVNDRTTKGLDNITGVDKHGNLYKLGLNIWPTLNVWIINSGWYKLVKANKAVKGDPVHIWGYRDIGKLCFAFNFKKKPEPSQD